jgi:hypothetical protein
VIVSDDIEELRRQLQDLLKRAEPSDQDIKSVQALINRLNELVTSAAATNSELAARLVKDVGRLRVHFDPTSGDIGVSPVWKGLRNRLAYTFEEVLGTSPMIDPSTIVPSDYAPLARTIFILEEVRQLITLCGAAQSAGAFTLEQGSILDALVVDLNGGTWDSLNRAARRVRKVCEGISYDQVEAQIKDQRVRIDANRIVVRQFEASELRAVFLDKRVQNSAAREEYTCNWFFEQSNLRTMGWTVSYLFPVATDADPQSRESDGGPRHRLWVLLKRLAKSNPQEEPVTTAIRPPCKVPFSTIELNQRSAIPNDVAALVSRRFVTASETNDGTRLNESRVKALTGCDPITARFLHGEFFTFRPVEVLARGQPSPDRS